MFKAGDEKLGRELDVVNIIRSIRQLRLMTNVLLGPSEKMLLKFQRKNIIETTSSSSDSDHHSYDTVKLLNSKKDLMKLQQIVKIKRILNKYKNRPLEDIDRNLIKGIFVRRPNKLYTEDKGTPSPLGLTNWEKRRSLLTMGTPLIKTQ